MGNFFEDIGDVLFGSQEDPSVQQVNTLSGPQTQSLNMINQLGRRFLGQGGDVPPWALTAGPGALTQKMIGQMGSLAPQAGAAFGRGLQPLNAQSIQQGSQPFFDAMMNQFTTGTGPGTQEYIANQFGALDSARSSGMGQAIGRGTAGFGPAAIQQFLGNRQFETQAGLQGLGFGEDVAARRDLQRQATREGATEKFDRSRLGMNPMTLPLLQLGLGTPAFGNIGMPGSQMPGIAGPVLGGLFQGAGAAGGFGNLFG